MDCRCRTDGQRPLSIAALAGENEKNVFEWTVSVELTDSVLFPLQLL